MLRKKEPEFVKFISEYKGLVLSDFSWLILAKIKNVDGNQMILGKDRVESDAINNREVP